MNYMGILKKAYKLALEHRFLWIFGILGGGYGGIKISNAPQFSGDSQTWEQFANQLNGVTWQSFWSQYGNLVAAAGILLLVVAIALAILNIISQAALIGSVNKLQVGHKTDFSDGFMIGWHNFWRVLGVGLTFVVFILVPFFSSSFSNICLASFNICIRLLSDS